ncbi:trifunctional dihydropteroate synthetase [Dimargaris verticillata]|uniref:Folic acid synthesis protein FOL1 n=1 Tax=Dimargaris verticillata TaxID=2761393 RepID=A0A9W8ECQ6_9FUNG|nr:trifunctional dihydropteroate synthetase [Dimargaris verticillata]
MASFAARARAPNAPTAPALPSAARTGGISTNQDSQADTIVIRDLQVRNIIGVDSWERVKRQPIGVSVTLQTESMETAARSDTVTDTINYGTLSKRVSAYSEDTAFKSVEALAAGILRICLAEPRALRATVRIDKPKALLQAAAAGVEISRTKQSLNRPALTTVDAKSLPDRIFVRDLRCSTIVGVNPWEREAKQVVVIQLQLWVHLDTSPLAEDYVPPHHNYRTIVRTLTQLVEASQYKTVEALASAIARAVITRCHVPKLTVRVEKPSALAFAAGAGVELTRTLADYASESEASAAERNAQLLDAGIAADRRLSLSQVVPSDSSRPHYAWLALGSNQGSPAQQIHEALACLSQSQHTRVTNTSFLYCTPPMYRTDQAKFLNCACTVQTNLAPKALLVFLKSIEADMGRDLALATQKRNGPRPIDLDILFYDRLVLTTDDLVIPHPRIAERLFVLFPLDDIAKDMEHPTLYKTCHQLLQLRLHTEPDHGIERVVPIRDQLWSWDRKTYLMGILNCTPDSFSDGGQWTNVSDAMAHAQGMVADGMDVLDIGGLSTRPNSEEIPVPEEIARIVPTIEALRQQAKLTTPISVDTYHSAVAEAAVQAGADMINDITGGLRDPRILQVAAQHRVPICLMHMRGDAKSMMSLTNYPSDTTDLPIHASGKSISEHRRCVVYAVAAELQACVRKALQAGIYRWNIIVDPGIGFAKTAAQDVELLRDLPRFTSKQSPLPDFPVLVGTSRKKFIGKLTDQPVPANRVYGTAATCAAAIAGGCNILRVHDVRAMRDVLRMSDSIWRRQL